MNYIHFILFITIMSGSMLVTMPDEGFESFDFFGEYETAQNVYDEYDDVSSVYNEHVTEDDKNEIIGFLADGWDYMFTELVPLTKADHVNESPPNPFE